MIPILEYIKKSKTSSYFIPMSYDIKYPDNVRNYLDSIGLEHILPNRITRDYRITIRNKIFISYCKHLMSSQRTYQPGDANYSKCIDEINDLLEKYA